jgi:hypothetical protein
VEAAGIEPASRGTSAEVSTCVVDALSLGRRTPVDRLPTAQRRESLARSSRRRPERASLLIVAPIGQQASPTAQAVWLGCLDLYCYRWGTSRHRA